MLLFAVVGTVRRAPDHKHRTTTLMGDLFFLAVLGLVLLPYIILLRAVSDGGWDGVQLLVAGAGVDWNWRSEIGEVSEGERMEEEEKNEKDAKTEIEE